MKQKIATNMFAILHEKTLKKSMIDKRFFEKAVEELKTFFLK